MAINKIVLWIVYFELQLTWSQIIIPDQLKECYTNSTAFNSSHPLNLRVLIDIIQKLEKQSHRTMDMRVLSSSLLHRFKFDGVEYQQNVQATDGVLPFRATGSQRVKQRLVEELIPDNGEILPVDILLPVERCMLHRAISNTILQPDSQCRNEFCKEHTETAKLSGKLTNTLNYPKQQGIILTPYGTVAPGTIIGAIAASLQRQNVPLNQLITSLEAPSLETNSTIVQTPKYDDEEIDFILPKSEMSHELSMWYRNLMTSYAELDNVWLTTIAGELAEMAVYQGPYVWQNMSLGATGFWNNTIRPTVYYLTSSHTNFDATRAELLGGIDGLIIANNLHSWIQDFYNLRLSQILDMYYSYKGIAFNTNIKACNRAQNFLHVVSNTTLNEQTYAAAKMLGYHRSIAYVSPDVLQLLATYAVKTFYSYAENRLFPKLSCQQVDPPRVEALIVFDGAWSIEYTKDFLGFVRVLTQDLDVSMYGSKMGIIHGMSGEWLLNVTNSPSLVFNTLNNFTEASWPTQFNYIQVLETIFNHLNETWENNRKQHITGSLGQVVVLLIPLGYMSNNDKQSTINILHKIRDIHPDVHFLYCTSRSNANLFKPFILTAEDYLTKDTNVDTITQYLKTIPRIIRPLMLLDSNNPRNITPWMEDYISPSRSTTYRLHSQWKRNIKKIPISIHTFGYGTMKVCSWVQFNERENERENYYCTELTGLKEITLPNDFKCDGTTPCPNMYFCVQNVTSSYKCAEIDCRTPDQVRFIIRTQNVYYKNSVDKKSMPISLIFVLLLAYRALT
ncbi:uncharacterized protein LOC117225430 [Megalopta genalis]|uniref:uncharacterized protein LOC117225430 n=1 Tax=Megalopta genalis TaxID=115081 RepID=UPI0014432CC3|nr:uncharacterized protein LOC117225430 [Megalopta genalis]